MNRIEYMTKLASLLQDIPEVERRDSMKYYKDYFDEAGMDIAGMSDDEILEASEVFALPSGRFLIVEG